MDEEFDKLAEAEDYHLQAEFILHELQANLEVYGSNSALSGAQPANIDLALQYSNRCLEYFPDNPKYLNLRALLIGEGLKKKDEAIRLLRRAHDLAPRDINIANNLKTFETSKCFVATAAYGTPFHADISALRYWRDNTLLKSLYGRMFVRGYYRLSPPIAGIIEKSELARKATRALLRPFVGFVKRRIEQHGGK